MDTIVKIIDVLWKYGYNGISIGLAVSVIYLIVWLFKKLFNNHLAHIAQDIKTSITMIKKIEDNVEKANSKIDELSDKIVGLDKRLSVRESVCEERHKQKNLS
jgi:hypothetical protein